MKARSVCAVVLLGLFLTATAQGQAPMISYQGKLTDNAGEPLNATVSIQFSIYSQATGGSSLWTETQSSVAVSNGIFDVLLGSVNSIAGTVFDGSDRWLGLKVGSDAEMSPRQQIVSVGYALMASDADMVDGQHASDFLSTASDWGRSGVTTDLYEGTTELSNKYLGISGKAADADKLDNYDSGDFASATHNHDDDYINTTGPEEMTGSINGHMLRIVNNDTGWAAYGVGCLHSSSSNFGYLGGSTKGVYGSSYSDWAGYFDGKTYMGGNVGIGTESPTRALHIYRSSGPANLGIVTADGGSKAQIIFGDDSGNEWTISDNHTDGDKLHFRSGLAAGTARVTFQQNGYVGIGTTNPGYKLHVIGDIAYTGNIYDVSDIRLKENIVALENAVEKVTSIRSIYFNNKGEPPEKREIGVIAQEVERVLPEVVSEDSEGYKSVDYTKFTPLLIEAVKELKAENELLRGKNTELLKRIEAIENIVGK